MLTYLHSTPSSAGATFDAGLYHGDGTIRRDCYPDAIRCIAHPASRYWAKLLAIIDWRQRNADKQAATARYHP